uniref:Uncharacterized protein n=1 Tax=Arundo donax TaxID=35708 RepID=A0A0A9A7A9_ARUDO
MGLEHINFKVQVVVEKLQVDSCQLYEVKKEWCNFRLQVN